VSSNTPSSSGGSASAGAKGSGAAGKSPSSGAKGSGGAGKASASKGSAPRKATGSRPLVRPAPRSKVRRAHLTVARIDLWSIAKLVFLLLRWPWAS
jgi:hypothetical protein